MKCELDRTGKPARELLHDRVLRQHEDRLAEVISVKNGPHREEADDDRGNGERNQRQGDDRRALMRFGMSILMSVASVLSRFLAALVVMMRGRAKSLRSMERHEEHAECVERGDEDAREHAAIRVA